VSYTSYARKAVTRNAGGFTVSGATATLAADQDFPKCTGGNAQAFFWTIGTAASGAGKVLYYGPLGSVLGYGVGAVSNTLTIPGLTGLAVDDRIVFYSTPGAVMPTGITEGQVYWVLSVSGSDITISATDGGAVVDVTAVGAFLAYRIAGGSGDGANAGIVIATNTIPRIEAGSAITES
jgi:hypothetical protein